MLYIFAGFPGCEKSTGSLSINAGGLEHCVETVENLAELEHDPAVQYRRDGVFAAGSDELLYPVEYRISDLCLRDGITWDWFPSNFSFGNGVTVHKTSASPEYKTVVHGTGLNLDEFLAEHGTTKLAQLSLERMHVKHEGWQEYETRWMPGTCPMESHVVRLTWLVTTHRVPEFAYERIRGLIEGGAEPENLDQYSAEAGKHFSVSRKWDGKPNFGRANAVP
jgi:hypothetical protein